jgi:hypothetical protein
MQIKESGGRVPGAKRAHPDDVEDHQIAVAEAVINDLNEWSSKLGVGRFA